MLEHIAMNPQNEPHISDRQRRILAIIIEEYVSSARPVASEHIVGHYGLNVSSATVRNDMVELERAGLIAQPHTSAGRAPTDRGYRYFVENLMTPTTLPVSEQRKIRHQFHQIETDANEWVRLATSVLARTVHSAALATAPRSAAVSLKHFEVLSISDRRILIVLVGHDGTVTQQMGSVDDGWDQERLSNLSAQLNLRLSGKTASEIREWATKEENVRNLPQLATEVLLPTLASMLSGLEKPETTNIYHEGLGHMLEQPEFRHPDRAQQLIELFERGNIWASIIASVLKEDGVQVVIGDEGQGPMPAFSIVMARYGFEGRLAGVLGVIGPVRMPYSRSISTVQYMSQLLSDMLYRAYNPQISGPGGDE
jgi:heat-inducible transcriptional repressor